MVNINETNVKRSANWANFLNYHNAIVACIVLLIITGNIITLVSLCRFQHLRRQQNALIGSLCVSDLCVGISITIWILFVIFFDGSQSFGSVDILATMCVIVSLFNFIIIGLDRFIGNLV